MPVNPFIRQNLASDSVASPFGNSRIGPYAYRSVENPTNLTVKGGTLSLQFPDDLPKYHFTIIECEWDAGSASVDAGAFGATVQNGPLSPFGTPYLTFQKIYKLPLPDPLNEAYQVNYDGGGNWIQMLEGPRAALGQLAGLATNDLKSVTLKAPQYRIHNQIWKLSPRNFAESVKIKDIIFNLKKGMHPRLAGSNNYAFRFPKIYLLFFTPNLKYLYKFKPCVLQAISIDYQGGNPQPSFYEAQQEFRIDSPYDSRDPQTRERIAQGINYTVQHSPPESVVLRTSWLELEYWLGGDENSDFSDTNDPFDAYNWFTNGGDTRTGLLNSQDPNNRDAPGWLGYVPGF